MQKSFFYGFLIFWIHSKPRPCPITRSPDFFHLIQNYISVFFFPFPDFLQKFFASQVMARNTLLFELFFHNILSRDSRVIGSRKPKSFIALHSFKSSQNLRCCVLKSVSHMKRSGNIWRGSCYRTCFTPPTRELIGIKKSALFPELINFILMVFRVVWLLKCRRHTVIFAFF